MTFSSEIGVLIPLSCGLSHQQIYNAVSEVPGLVKDISFSKHVIIKSIERKWGLFNKEKEEKKYVKVSVDSSNFDTLAQESLIENGHISVWSLPKEMSSILLNGSAEIENSQLWTPESIGIEHRVTGCNIEIGDTEVLVQATKIYLWGYGYFFPHKINDVINILANNVLFKSMHDIINKCINNDCERLNTSIGETGAIAYVPDFRLPVFAQQSF